jgi:hypothetical protein
MISVKAGSQNVDWIQLNYGKMMMIFRVLLEDEEFLDPLIDNYFLILVLKVLFITRVS